MTLKSDEKLQRIFEKFKDKVLIIEKNGNSLTYDQIKTYALNLGIYWKSIGLKEDDCIAICLDNNVEFLICYLACFFNNFIAIPIDKELKDIERDTIINISKAKIIITRTEEKYYRNGKKAFFHHNINSSKVCSIFFTSGSTGDPKGVCHSLSSLIQNCLEFNKLVGISSKSVMYHVLPMSYMAGFLNTFISPLVSGSSIVLGERFSAMSAMFFWKQVVLHKPSILWLTPSMASLLIKLSKKDNKVTEKVKSLKQIFCGTAPLSSITKEKFFDTFDIKLQESYGLSELLLISAQKNNANSKFSNVGEIIKKIDIKISGEKTNEGEILVKTPFLFLYYKHKEGFEEPKINSSGYFFTGDLGYIRNGELYVVGRIKDIIIRGGFNISPILIEEKIRVLPEIIETAVIGIPDDFWGERIGLFVETYKKYNNSRFISKLKLKCKEILPHNYQPDEIKIINPLPKSSTGKIRKKLILENYYK